MFGMGWALGPKFRIRSFGAGGERMVAGVAAEAAGVQHLGLVTAVTSDV